jgi:hypothetical protein
MIFTVAEEEHKLASVTATEYVPAVRPLIEAELWPPVHE